MSDDRLPGVPTRRQLLLGLGTLGAASTLGGGAASAMLSDREGAGGTIAAGDVSLAVDCADCVAGTNGVAFDLSVDPGESGETSLSVTPGGNPIRLWLRTTCPPVDDAFGEALEVSLGLDADCDGTPESTLFTGSLAALRRSLVSGVRLEPTGECLEPDEPVCLVLAWTLPADATLAPSTTPLSFEFYAEQCRHQPESAVTDPFAGTDPCPEPEGCPHCVELGKIDVQDDRLREGEVIGFGDGDNEQYRTDGHDYALEVRSVTAKEPQNPETVGVGFRLLRDGEPAADLRICSVAVGGGRPNPNSHPSDPDARVARYTFDPPAASTPGQVYAAHGGSKDDPLSQPHDERPAISNLTVAVCAEDDDRDDEHRNDENR